MVPKSTTMDDPEWPIRTLLQKNASFGAQDEHLDEGTPTIIISGKNVGQ